MTALRDVYLTPEQAAELLHRSVKQLYRLIKADSTLPRLKLPGKARRDGRRSCGGLLFPRLAFERWLHDHTEGMRHPLRLAVVTPTSEAPQRINPSGELKGG
jgi:Helix-turn-helix domain